LNLFNIYLYVIIILLFIHNNYFIITNLQVVGGDVSGRGGPPPPLQDRYTALALLMELDIQKVELRAGNL